MAPCLGPYHLSTPTSILDVLASSTRKERPLTLWRLTVNIYKNSAGNPRVSWTDAHPLKKKVAFVFFPLKCDLFRQTSLKQSAVTRHNVPKNMVTSRARLAHPAEESVTFGRSEHLGTWPPCSWLWGKKNGAGAQGEGGEFSQAFSPNFHLQV